MPIMMKERQISVVAVGLVFAAMPLIFQFGRMIFATLSDFWRARATFRHWKATTLYHQIKDPYYVKQFLGHKSLSSTEVYINIERTMFESACDEFTVKVRET